MNTSVTNNIGVNGTGGKNVSGIGVSGIIGGFAIGIILAVIIYFAFIRDTTKIKPEACPVCPEAKECPACPACPVAKECPVCPEAKACPEAKECPPCPLCEVCEDKACPACEDKDTILGFPIKHGGVIMEELDIMENKLSPHIHKIVCGILSDPKILSNIEKRDEKKPCDKWSDLVREDFNRIIDKLENLPSPRNDNSGIKRYIYDNNMHLIAAKSLGQIRENIINELCPPGKEMLRASELAELFKKVRKNICERAGTIPNFNSGFVI